MRHRRQVDHGKIIKLKTSLAWSPKATPQPPTLFKLENEFKFMDIHGSNMPRYVKMWAKFTAIHLA
jgi:hypothetical protein